MYTWATSLPNLYIRNIMPDDMGIPLLERITLSGWGYTHFHASVNFAFWGFSEVGGRFSALLVVFIFLVRVLRGFVRVHRSFEVGLRSFLLLPLPLSGKL